MKIALAQIDPVVGDFESNFQKIKKAYERACLVQARFLLAPELAVCGYPPHDLMDRPEMFDRNEDTLNRLAKLTEGKTTALAVGHVARNPQPHGRAGQNVVSVLENGRVVFSQAKTLLPTYDVFDEARYFEPASQHAVWECKTPEGIERVAFAICEDLWGEDQVLGRRLYGKNPVEEYVRLKPTLMVSASASPYEYGKRVRREGLHSDIAKRLKSPLVYVNQTGATDDVLFDGASFAIASTGELRGRLPAFQTSFAIFDTATQTFPDVDGESREDVAPEDLEVLTRALITGIREYFQRTGFKLAILGLSGGIDSAVIAALAVEALGSKNVLGVAMPSQYSSAHSLSDAEALAQNLGIPFLVKPIKFLFSTAVREFGTAQGLSDLAQENLQSRLRGNLLMTLSNHYSALVLTTGNKSEIATGYCTLYGDMCGALAPIGDVLKTRVWDLARHLNATRGNKIPESSITKAPSAELKPGQTDQDTLPPYAELDAMLEEYLEKFVPVEELVKRHGAWTKDILRRIEVNEHKRRQAAPILKVSTKAFGVGRRVPIAKKWDQ